MLALLPFLAVAIAALVAPYIIRLGDQDSQRGWMIVGAIAFIILVAAGAYLLPDRRHASKSAAVLKTLLPGLDFSPTVSREHLVAGQGPLRVCDRTSTPYSVLACLTSGSLEPNAPRRQADVAASVNV